MHSRSSLVNWVYVTSLDSSGIVQIGDSNQITPETKIYALQREQPIFNGNEVEDLTQFPIYSQPLPLPLLTEDLRQTTIHENPVIKVGSIRITGIAASSVLHVGSTRTIRTEARVKHNREYFSDPYAEED
ncbi:spore germination protein GerPE [Bacillus hwajinpoensis]|uniref:Spore germination protein GerPE n=1 Tax=Guptibacillus hwajinpoensis TaxID=208199 RepID=A0A845F1U5_9BACL|nr:spore germination protein GerPE [Pseudalkalibacillus hwajinpoensis]MYL64675.1 spore germination protein GerPE [Pseudalkalibacillus hwajinpoensis]